MSRKTILVVDDEPRTRQGIKKTLETWSSGRHDILDAESAAYSIEILKKQKVHLLISDICMPEMTGLEMLDTLKKQKQDPVVIILSAYSEFTYAQEAIRLGVHNYLLKPVNKIKLIEVVEGALEFESSRERIDMIQRVVDHKLVDLKLEAKKDDSPITKAIKYVDDNLSNHLSLNDVAKHVHLNSSYLSVLFKEQVNMTFSEYVTRSRLQLAKQLLINTDKTITNIAEEAGYGTSKYFIKLFKEHEGLTPSKYRKLIPFEG
ncbi:response regulator transcription factor [Litchfieldia salsa]|uniref:Helix-turn-helix domain-containing protein n=1 Tax=Litchfieldia salsa TaxID=930152 RepID=A0A1H0RSM4_9BACI|nr:response regulator [Litchfieldia salsa]SDP32443.1 Helix-turn-helix domain-containing protein [Litchfieldia salsa]